MVFTIEFDGAVDLGIEEIWPDRDNPENPNVNDAIAQIKKEGSVSVLIDRWNLGSSLSVSVNGKPVYFSHVE